MLGNRPWQRSMQIRARTSCTLTIVSCIFHCIFKKFIIEFQNELFGNTMRSAGNNSRSSVSNTNESNYVNAITPA